jgi:hypothetical protein
MHVFAVSGVLPQLCYVYNTFSVRNKKDKVLFSVNQER